MPARFLRWLSERSPHSVFLIIAGVNALVLTVLNPPFQVHDEFQHFLRAYQLSEGQLWGVSQDGLGGSVLPASFPDFIQRMWGTLRIHQIPPLGEHPLTDTLSELSRPLAPHDRAFVDFSGSVNYSPLPYIPQTIAIAIGRLFEAPPLALLYMGRLLNAAVAVAIIWWSLKILPMGRLFALVIALLPMTQYEYASVAPDATVIAAAFLFTAIALRAKTRARWTVADVCILSVTGSLFCSVKPVYAAMLLAGLALPRRTSSEADRGINPILVYAIVVFVAVGLTGAWLLSAPSLSLPAPELSPTAQLAHIMENPLGFVVTLLRDLAYHGAFYIIDGIGILGAFTVYLPSYAYLIAEACIILACIYPHDDVPPLDRASVWWNWFLILSTVVLIQTALYLFATRVGSPLVFGVQGRYFLALGALVGATLISSLWARHAPPKRPIMGGVVIMLVALNTFVMDVTIVRGFGVF